MTDTADRILHDLRRRRDELRPLVAELDRIEAAIDALERAVEPAPATGARRNGGNGTAAASARARPRRGRPRKGQPNRTDQFLALVREGGTSIPAAAKELGIGPNYLYRIAASLEREGTISRQGREYVMTIAGQPSENADVLPEPGAPAPGDAPGDLVTDEGVNEGTGKLATE